MEVRKGQNMIEHEAEIYGRPARTWFQSEKEKKKAQGETLRQWNRNRRSKLTRRPRQMQVKLNISLAYLPTVRTTPSQPQMGRR